MGSSALLDDLDGAASILWLGPDPKEELPVLYLRLRRAVMHGTRLVVVGPRRTSLSELGIHAACPPGGEDEALSVLLAEPGAGPDAGGRYAEAVEALQGGPVIVCAGQPFVGLSVRPALDRLAAWITRRREARLMLCVPNANSQGALDMGIFPGFGPGHRPAVPGLDTAGMLRAAAGGRIKFLWLMGADLVSDFPDAGLADAALSSDAFIVVSELFPTDTARAANVMLPVASMAEKDGSYTNLERRIQKLDEVLPAPGSVRTDWRIAHDIARRLGADWGWSSASDVSASIAASIAANVPTHAQYTWELLTMPPPPPSRSRRCSRRRSVIRWA
ncbi:MAG: molybdopterin oxidoreductase family protein [Actinomycetota bacterium]